MNKDTLEIFDIVVKSKQDYSKKNNNKKLIDSLKQEFVSAKKNRYLKLTKEELEVMNSIIQVNNTYVKMFMCKKDIELAIINNEVENVSKYIGLLPVFTNKCLWFIYSVDKPLLEKAIAISKALTNKVIEALKLKYKQ